jgi:hypothetical protein
VSKRYLRRATATANTWPSSVTHALAEAPVLVQMLVGLTVHAGGVQRRGGLAGKEDGALHVRAEGLQQPPRVRTAQSRYALVEVRRRRCESATPQSSSCAGDCEDVRARDGSGTRYTTVFAKSD